MDQTVVSNLVAKLSLDTSGFTSAASSINTSNIRKSVQSAVDDIDIDIKHFDLLSEAESIGQVNAELDQMWNTMDRAYGLAVNVTEEARSWITTARSIETAWVGVTKTVNAPEGVDPDAFFGDLKNEVYQLSTEMPSTFQEIAETMSKAAANEISTDNLVEFTEAMLQFESATNGVIKAGDAAETFAKINILTKGAEGDIDNLASSVVELGNHFGVQEKPVLDMSLAIASAGHNFGLTNDQIVGWAAAISKTGMSAQSAGRAFRTLTTQMQNAVKEGNADLQVFAETANMTTEEFVKCFGDDASDALLKFFEGLSPENLNEVFSALNIGMDQEKLLITNLTNTSDKAAEALDMSTNAFNENTALANEAAAANETLDAQIQMFQNTITAIQGQLGESLLPIIKEIGDALLPILRDVTQFIADNPELATTITSVAIAFEGLAIAAQIASTAMMMGSLGLAPWIGAVAVIGALVAVLALLSTSLDEIEAKASQTAEEIANIDIATQTVVENRLGEFEVVNYEYDLVTIQVEGTWNEYEEVEARYDASLGRYITREEDLANAAANTVSVIEDQTSAFENQQSVIETTADTIADNSIGEQLTETMEQPKSTAEQAQEILDQMNASLTGLTDSTDDFGSSWDASMASMTELMESEAFRQFSSQPIDQTVADSWNAFSEAVDKAVTGFSAIQQNNTGFTELPVVPENVITSYQALAEAVKSLNKALTGSGDAAEEETPVSETAAPAAGEEETAGMSLMTALTALPEQFLGILTAATQLTDYFNGAFQEAVAAAIKVLCKGGTNEKGEETHAGGNTLYTAAGAVKGVFEDIVTSTNELINLWKGPFTPAANKLKEACGIAEGAAQAAASAAMDAAVYFNSWADAIERVIAALKKLGEITGGGANGGGSGFGFGFGFGGFRALGGEVGQAKTYVVGEEGPELFVPKEDGYIISNDELEDNADMFIPHPKPGGEVGNEILEDLNAGSVVIINFNGDVIGDEESISGYVENAARTAMMEEIYAAF